MKRLYAKTNLKETMFNFAADFSATPEKREHLDLLIHNYMQRTKLTSTEISRLENLFLAFREAHVKGD